LIFDVLINKLQLAEPCKTTSTELYHICETTNVCLELADASLCSIAHNSMASDKKGFSIAAPRNDNLSLKVPLGE